MSKNEDWSNLGWIVGGVIVVILVFAVWSAQHNHDMGEINSWAKKNNYTIKSIEYCSFNRGPYWYVDSDSCRVYQVFVIPAEKMDSDEYYFCFTYYGGDYKKVEE